MTGGLRVGVYIFTARENNNNSNNNTHAMALTPAPSLFFDAHNVGFWTMVQILSYTLESRSLRVTLHVKEHSVSQGLGVIRLLSFITKNTFT